MGYLFASIVASALFALSSVAPGHAGSPGGAPTIGAAEAWSLLSIGALALVSRLVLRRA